MEPAMTALRAEFPDQSHFTRFFRRHSGRTASDNYRHAVAPACHVELFPTRFPFSTPFPFAGVSIFSNKFIFIHFTIRFLEYMPNTILWECVHGIHEHAPTRKET